MAAMAKMKVQLTFLVDEEREFTHADVMDEMASALSACEEIEGAAVECIRCEVFTAATNPDRRPRITMEGSDISPDKTCTLCGKVNTPFRRDGTPVCLSCLQGIAVFRK
jgi:hypothetical protein